MSTASEVERTFRNNLGNANLTIRAVRPVPAGPHQDRYQRKLSTLSSRNEQLTWHGTKKESAEAIMREGFRMELAGTVNGSAVGKGAYFARNVPLSHGYTRPGPDNVRTVLYCKVIVGTSCIGSSGMLSPAAGCHSARDNSNTMIVVFSSDQILPLFIIEYTVD